MTISALLRAIARLVAAGVAYVVLFLISYGLLVPSPPGVAGSDGLPSLSQLLLVTGLNTAVMSWLVLRSRRSGWRLATTLGLVFFGVQTLLPQSESLVFQAFSGFASHMPLGVALRLFPAGLLHACLWIPLTVRILGRWEEEKTPERERRLASGVWGWRLGLAAAVYVVLYFTFGYYVAWRNPAVTAYYRGIDPGTFWLQLQHVLHQTPWLPAVQVLRGLLWTAAGLTVSRTMRGSVTERALAVGALFAVMSAGLLLPNPYMPRDVRMAHLAETTSSDFLFGCLVVWLFAQGETADTPFGGSPSLKA